MLQHKKCSSKVYMGTRKRQKSPKKNPNKTKTWRIWKLITGMFCSTKDVVCELISWYINFYLGQQRKTWRLMKLERRHATSMYDEIRPLFVRFRAVLVNLKEYPGKTSPSEESAHPAIYLLRSLWNFYLNCLIFGRKCQVHELIRRDVDFYQCCDLTRIFKCSIS